MLNLYFQVPYMCSYDLMLKYRSKCAFHLSRLPALLLITNIVDNITAILLNHLSP